MQVGGDKDGDGSYRDADMGASPAVMVVVVVVVVGGNDVVCRNRVPATGVATSTPGVSFWPRRRSLLPHLAHARGLSFLKITCSNRGSSGRSGMDATVSLLSLFVSLSCGGHGRTPSSALQPRSWPYPNMGDHGGHTHNYRPPTEHSSCQSLVDVAILVLACTDGHKGA
eukprot:scaffold6050_cov57-Attheya_sp.AAC.1